jgi:hypothetical protein
VLFLVACAVPTRAEPRRAPQTSPPATAVDRAFSRLYNFDFPGALAALDAAVRVQPDQPLPYAVRAGTYLFMEMDRLRILETRFFMNDDNLVDGAGTLRPDPRVRDRLFAALEDARRRAGARLATSPEDTDALFAMCMSASVEIDYTALVERRAWRSLKLAPSTLVHARTLLARTPPFYDAYVNVGSLEYIVGDLPFFIRWFVRYDGVEGSKRKGIDQLKLTAQYGRHYGPFARVLLVVVSIRERKLEDAEQWLAGLVRDFPENPLFKKELAIISQQVRGRGKK